MTVHLFRLIPTIVAMALFGVLQTARADIPNGQVPECRADANKALILLSGSHCYLRPGQHVYTKFVIPDQAHLLVPAGSGDWLMLHVEGNAQIHGQITFRHFDRRRKKVDATASDGTPLSHEYQSIAVGGSGGMGGHTSTFQDSKSGGKGALGTQEYGGGGGSGAGYIRVGRRETHYPGIDATDHRGAPPPRGAGGKGGNGGVRTQNSNGGLIYFRVEGTLFSSGFIDLAGDCGPPGANGERDFHNRGIGDGGGGGGGPGADGGVLMVDASRVRGHPTVDVSGGGGGAPGIGYQNGTAGQTGALGKSCWTDRSVGPSPVCSSYDPSPTRCDSALASGKS